MKKMGKRLFIAVSLPEPIREKIYRTVQLMQTNGIKTVEKENLHITLKFLGNTKPALLQKTILALEKIRFREFEVCAAGIGQFGSNVIWAGVEDKQQMLEKINKEINALLSLKEENFHTHITIARNKKMPKHRLQQLLLQIDGKTVFGKFFVKSIELMESDLKETGPVYTKIYSKKSC